MQYNSDDRTQAVKQYDAVIDDDCQTTWLEDALYLELLDTQVIASNLNDQLAMADEDINCLEATVASLSHECYGYQRVSRILVGVMEEILEQGLTEERKLDAIQAIEEYDRLP